MFVSDIMSTDVTECTEDTRLEEAFELIRQCDHNLVVVVDSLAHRIPIGIVTERSICEQIVARGRNPRGLSAGSVMDSRIRKVVKNDIARGLDKSELDGIAAIVVVDEDRRLCGLIAKDEIRNLPRPVTRAFIPAPVTASPSPKRSRRISEIPAFGWIQ